LGNDNKNIERNTSTNSSERKPVEEGGGIINQEKNKRRWGLVAGC
jgi:hypothetical protein